MTCCRRRELGGQHVFYQAPGNRENIAPRNYFPRDVMLFVVFETPISPRNRKNIVLELSLEALFVPATENMVLQRPFAPATGKTGLGTNGKKDLDSLHTFPPHTGFENR